ncbi:hypothetical protein A9Q81_18650 [Gammaproteobacteria bacterium 42_54_T18]|nr:hypothetical protein A9Q81_18650 [Gammaproteobacteria bacterium 42_54_T18]
MFEHLPSNQWLLILCIPIVGAMIGWATNVLGCILTYGANPKSNWGLIHFKQKYFTQLFYQQLLRGRLSSTQLYEHMGPEKMVKHIVQSIRPRLDSIIDDAMETDHDIFWENLPITVKNRFYARAHKLLPRIIDDLVESIGDSIGRLIKPEHIILKNLTSNEMSIGWIVKQTYIGEIQKLPIRGLLIGYTLGLGLLIAWLMIPHWALLVGGYCVIAIATTWFGQSKLTNAKPHTLNISNILATNALSPHSVVNALLSGSSGKHTHSLIKKHSAPIIEQASLRAFTQLTIGPTGYAAVKHQLTKNIKSAYAEALNDKRFNDAQRQRIETYITQSITPPSNQASSQGMREDQAIQSNQTKYNIKNDPSAIFIQQVKKIQMLVLLPIALLVGSFAGITLQLLIWNT